MHNKHLSKRKQQAILFFTYGFMTLATIVISAICLLLVLGYRLDTTDGKLEQGGLLQFRSVPSGADITVDGQKLSYQTPGKMEVAAGRHSVGYDKKDYHSWKKDVAIDAGQLLWLNYARLIPQTLTSTDVMDATAVTAALPTQDRKFIATVSAQKPNEIHIVDLTNLPKTTTRTFVISDELLGRTADQPVTVSFAEWDFGARYLLASYVVGDTTNYVRIDRSTQDGSPYNLTKEFNLPFSAVHFSGTSGNILYALTGRDLRKVDTGAKSVSQPLIGDVETYQLYRENDISFTAQRADKKVAGVFIDNKEMIVRQFTATEPVITDLSQYYSDHYLAVVSRTHLDIIKNPQKLKDTVKPYVALTMPYDGVWVDFASSGRMIAAGNGLPFTVYDLETDDHASVNDGVSGGDIRPKWADDFTMLDNPDGTVRFYEYDGMNAHKLVAADTALPVFFSEDDKYFMSFAPLRNGKRALQATRMILE